MAEYIEREYTIKLIVSAIDSGLATTSDDLAEIIEDIPAADVVPVVHGQWVRNRGPYGQIRLYCSACNEHSGLQKEKSYCPNCGARMDGEVINQ